MIDFKLLIINLAFAHTCYPYTYYRLFDHAQKYCFFSIAHAVIQTCLTITLLVLGFNVTGVMVSGVVCTFIILALTLSDMRSALKVSYSRFSWRIKKSQAVFLLSIIASGLFVYAGNGAENWFIVAEFNEKLLASYYVAAQFAIITPHSHLSRLDYGGLLTFNLSNKQNAISTVCYNLIKYGLSYVCFDEYYWHLYYLIQYFLLTIMVKIAG